MNTYLVILGYKIGKQTNKYPGSWRANSKFIKLKRKGSMYLIYYIMTVIIFYFILNK